MFEPLRFDCTNYEMQWFCKQKGSNVFLDVQADLGLHCLQMCYNTTHLFIFSNRDREVWASGIDQDQTAPYLGLDCLSFCKYFFDILSGSPVS